MIPRFVPPLSTAELGAALWPGAHSTTAFERAFAKLAGQRAALAFPYGRTALAFLLEALGLRGKEVLMPAYTCVVVAHAVVTSGNEPVFVDSRDDDFNMDLNLASEKVTARTGALIATSIFGYPVDLDALDVFRSRHPKVLVIQDCAHSFMAEWKGRPVQKEGVAAIYGLNISKIISSIFGGMISTDDLELEGKLRALRASRLRRVGIWRSLTRSLYLTAARISFLKPVYGMTRFLEKRRILDRFVRYFDEGKIGMPEDWLEALSGAQSRVGLVQVGRYPEILARRRALASFYDRRLAGLQGLRLPPSAPGATYSHYAIRASDPQGLAAKAESKGVQLGRIIDYSIPEMSAYQNRPGASAPCPVASRLARTTLNLPLGCSSRDAEYSASVLEGLLKE